MKTFSILTILLFSCVVHAQETTNTINEFNGVAGEFNLLTSVEIPVETSKTVPETEEFTFTSLKKLSLKEVNFSSEKGFSFIDSQPKNHDLTDSMNHRFQKERLEQKSGIFPLVLVHVNRCD